VADARAQFGDSIFADLLFAHIGKVAFDFWLQHCPSDASWDQIKEALESWEFQSKVVGEWGINIDLVSEFVNQQVAESDWAVYDKEPDGVVNQPIDLNSFIPAPIASSNLIDQPVKIDNWDTNPDVVSGFVSEQVAVSVWAAQDPSIIRLIKCRS
jgi:hypothetical protein